MGRGLIYTVDTDSWVRKDAGTAIREIRSLRPLVIRIANFDEASEQVLRSIPSNQVVAWKLEYTGDETPHAFLKSSRGIRPDEYVTAIRSLPHRTVAYTFTEFNRQGIRDRLPATAGMDIRVVPLAQKRRPRGDGCMHEAWRELSHLRAGGGFLFGIGGLLSPTKGIEEVVERFVSWEGSQDNHLLCAVIAPGRSGDDIYRGWCRRYGAERVRNVHVRSGEHGDWGFMYSFYRTVDVVLVNSIHESWGRMVSEPAGVYTPTIVRRARCSTNFIVPDITLTDEIRFGGRLLEQLSEARRKVDAVGNYVTSVYSTRNVARIFVRQVVEPLLDTRESSYLKTALSEEEGMADLNHALTY